MSHLIVSLAWCCVQVFAVAAIATLLSRLVMRRSPGSAAAIALSGVLTAIGLTLIIPVRIPASMHEVVDLSQLFDNPREISGQQGAGLAVNAGQGSSRTIAPEHEPEAGARFALGLPLMKRVADSLRRGEIVVSQQRRAVAIAAGILAIGSLFCVGRLLWGVWAIARINGASRVVSDDCIRDAFHELRPYFAGGRVPEVKETDQLAHAAVVGCWRQAIILSNQWREWSPGELKAVLAHEWAHIVRHDFASRIVASLCVALQWFQPLAYGLRRQLILTQELAADELAAAAIGSRVDYLRALAQLALRQDSRPIGGSTEMLLPVFSGFLMRRIEMLRAKDCSPRYPSRSILQWSAIGFLVAIAASTTALRGLAQPPEKEEDGSVRVATGIKTLAKSAAERKEPGTVDPTVFQRQPFDIAKLPLGKGGGILVRVGEILKQPRFAGVAREQNESIVKFLKMVFPDWDAPALSLGEIDYIAGDFVLSAKFVPEPKPERTPHEVMFGTSCVFVRWRADVNGIFEALVRIPDTARKTHVDIAYVELPEIPAMGPARTCVALLDANTLMWVGGDAEAMIKRLDRLAAGGEGQPWHDAWTAGEGGLVTAVSAKPEFKSPEDATLDESAELMENLFAKTKLLTVSADWQGSSDGDLALKLQLFCESEADATATRDAIQRAIEMSAQEASNDAEKAASSKEKAAAEIVAAFLKQAQIETNETEGGWEIGMYFNGPIDVRALVVP